MCWLILDQCYEKLRRSTANKLITLLGGAKKVTPRGIKNVWKISFDQARVKDQVVRSQLYNLLPRNLSMNCAMPASGNARTKVSRTQIIIEDHHDDHQRVLFSWFSGRQFLHLLNPVFTLPRRYHYTSRAIKWRGYRFSERGVCGLIKPIFYALWWTFYWKNSVLLSRDDDDDDREVYKI